MLSFFRTNQEFIGILLIPVLFLFLGTGWWEIPAMEPSPAFGPLAYPIIYWMTSHVIAGTILVGVCIFGTALLLNKLIINNRLNREINLFPGLILVIFSLSILEFKAVFLIHLANLCFLLALSNSFRVYKKLDIAATIFNMGFWVGLASLFYGPYIFLLLWGFFSINTLRNINLKEPLIMLSGALVAYFLTATVFLALGDLPVFISTFLDSFGFMNFGGKPNPLDWVKIGSFSILLILVITSFSSYQIKKTLEIQKKIGSLYYALFAVGLSIFFISDLHIYHFLLLAVPISCLLAFSLTDLPAGPAEVLFMIVLLGLLGIQYSPYIL
ncbi:MAG: hypothetical protein KDC34_00790 [Saprospiraceae bacterium]|nr:hypothetical protein [Saprospiraceae bacterium]